MPVGNAGDPLATLGTVPTEPYQLGDRRMSIAGLLLYAARNVTDLLWRRHENRMVCIPGSFITELRQRAIKELESRNVATGNSERPWVSEGDVLCAWWTRVAISSLPMHPETTVLLNNAFSLRKRLENDLLPASQPYLSNAVGFINVLMSVGEILQNPVSHLAAHIRRCINEHGTRSQVEAFTAMIRETKSRLPPFFGNSGMHMITYSNWTKAKLYDVDFSSAVVTSSTANGDSKRFGRPSYTQNSQMGVSVPNAFPIMGKDLDGNYWLSGFMTQGTWAKLEAILAKEAVEAMRST